MVVTTESASVLDHKGAFLFPRSKSVLAGLHCVWFQLNVRNKSAAKECYIRTEFCLEGLYNLNWLHLYWQLYISLKHPFVVSPSFVWWCDELTIFSAFYLEQLTAFAKVSCSQLLLTSIFWPTKTKLWFRYRFLHYD